MRRALHPQALIAIALIAVAIVAVHSRFSSTTLILFAVVVPSIVLHEVAHGVVAAAFGDDTAKLAGRLTLNPVKHVDPLGTLILPAILAISGLAVFGYAKPVPINPARMRHPRNDTVIVSLAGPATNLVLAALSIVLLRDARPAGTAQAVEDVIAYAGLNAVPLLDRVIFLLGFVNVTLAVFNAIPLPPLDGSAVIERLLPRSAWASWAKVRQWGMPILLLLVLLDPGQFLLRIFLPAEREWARLLVA